MLYFVSLVAQMATFKKRLNSFTEIQEFNEVAFLAANVLLFLMKAIYI
jgi:hypothetical protein